MNKKNSIFLAIFIGNIAVLLLFIDRFIENIFLSFDIDQALWHFSNTPEYVASLLIDVILTYCGIALIVMFLWGLFVVVVNKLFDSLHNELCLPNKKKIFVLPKTIFVTNFLVILMIIACGCLFVDLNNRTNFSTWLSAQIQDSSDDFFEQNYSVPSLSEIQFPEKKNLIIVLAESLETTFASDSIPGGPFLTGINNHLASAQKINHLREVYGTRFTIGAITGWGFGLPLRLPFPVVEFRAFDPKRSFLPGAQSIFDVLSKNGFKLVFICGSNSKFAGQLNMLQQHGKFEVKDRDYWISHGYSLEKHAGSEWGFSDSFILDRIIEEYEKLSKRNQPFVILSKTADLHGPNGWCPDNLISFHDQRDAIVQSDRVLTKFLDELRKQLRKNDVLALIGDHYFMGKINFIKNINREIVNGFWGDIKTIPEKKQNEISTPLDIAPTLIQAAGAKWKNDQYGVGVSFWSEDSSLAEKIGLKSLEKSLMQWSNRYSKVFWAPSNNPYVLQQPQSIIHNGSNNAQEQEKTKETPRSEPFPDYRVIR